jgi:hypothetical protein
MRICGGTLGVRKGRPFSISLLFVRSWIRLPRTIPPSARNSTKSCASNRVFNATRISIGKELERADALYSRLQARAEPCTVPPDLRLDRSGSRLDPGILFRRNCPETILGPRSKSTTIAPLGTGCLPFSSGFVLVRARQASRASCSFADSGGFRIPRFYRLR